MSGYLNKILFWGIKTWQLLALAIFYAFFAFILMFTLYASTQGRFWGFYQTMLRFIVIITITVPLWWLYFKRLSQLSPVKTLLLHIVTGFVWGIVLFNLYHWLCDIAGVRYLKGADQYWDIYFTSLFYVLQFGIFHLYDAYLKIKKQKELEAELRNLQYQSELNALKAQLQPHFLFNTLNSISATVPPELESTRELIAKLADIFRYSLNATKHEWVTLEKELGFVKTYLELEKERYMHKLEIKYSIDTVLLDQLIPPMILQPLVENAIKHGIGKSIFGGKIHISIREEENKLKFVIADTGAGINDKKIPELFNKGIGLHNTAVRLQKIYGEDIIVQHNVPSGLTISFTIPKN